MQKSETATVPGSNPTMSAAPPVPTGTATTTLLLVAGLVLALLAFPASAEPPRAEIPPPGEEPEGTEEAFDLMRRARSVEHLRINKYEIPNEEIPLLYLFDDFFAMYAGHLEDPVFLKRLDIEPRSQASAVLTDAFSEYQANQPTEADRRASADAFAALANDSEGWDALGRQQAKARAASTADVVHRLAHGLEASGTSLAGVRLYIEGNIRPNNSVTSDRPGGDPEWFERGREFCEISRLPDCMRGNGGDR